MKIRFFLHFVYVFLMRVILIVVALFFLALIICLLTTNLSLENFASFLGWVGIGTIVLGVMAVKGAYEGTQDDSYQFSKTVSELPWYERQKQDWDHIFSSSFNFYYLFTAGVIAVAVSEFLGL